MKKISKYFSKCSDYQVMGAISSVILLIVIVSAVLVYSSKNISPERLDFLGAIIGSLIGLTGIMMTISYTSHNTEIQLAKERKNSFDSAIGVENYKQLLNMANSIGSYLDELVNVEECLYDVGNINKYNSLIKDLDIKLSKSMDYINNNFYSILDFYRKREIYGDKFNYLFCNVVNDRLNVEEFSVNELQKLKDNLQKYEDDLLNLKNYVIKTATEIIR